MDRRAFDAGTDEAALMERAAGHLARGILAAGRAATGRAYGLRVGILCGRGNNGGDGLAAARRLLDAGAGPCRVRRPRGGRGPHRTPCRACPPSSSRATARPAGASPAPSRPRSTVRTSPSTVCSARAPAASRGPPYDAAVRALVDHRDAGRGPVVACDLPTGVDADTGRVPGLAVRADVTVTLGARKRGLALEPARGHAGRVVLGEFGIVTADDEPVATVLEPADAAALVPAPAADAHKRTRGVVVVLAGSPGMAGAAVLVARGCLAGRRGPRDRRDRRPGPGPPRPSRRR